MLVATIDTKWISYKFANLWEKIYKILGFSKGNFLNTFHISDSLNYCQLSYCLCFYSTHSTFLVYSYSIFVFKILCHFIHKYCYYIPRQNGRTNVRKNYLIKKLRKWHQTLSKAKLLLWMLIDYQRFLLLVFFSQTKIYSSLTLWQMFLFATIKLFFRNFLLK